MGGKMEGEIESWENGRMLPVRFAFMNEIFKFLLLEHFFAKNSTSLLLTKDCTTEPRT